MKKLLIIVIIFAGSNLFIACKEKSKTAKKAESTTEKTTEENEDKNAAEATLTADQIRTIHIELGSIEQKQLTASLKTNGILKVPNQNKATINSVYSGIVKSLLIQPGNTVVKGQTIATIANPEFIQIQSEYLGINSKIVLAEQENNRQKELNAGNAGALKNLQASEAELKALRSR
ncbi:MAG: efflux RND transporter periplasmic adaptor subunit, partial [Sphingobacteriales bacterium]|nr:efflux RND transporter periplasmic adaptor subunit [Sphingobacteriales bacterium]